LRARPGTHRSRQMFKLTPVSVQARNIGTLTSKK
jgi:hypothetical protein